jgi:hypothetical protein
MFNWVYPGDAMPQNDSETQSPDAQPAEAAPAADAKSARVFDTRFFTAVVILLAVIIILLTGLWVRAYRRQLSAEIQANQSTLQYQNLQTLAQQVLANKPLQVGIDRASLPHVKAIVNDREIDALLLPPRLGTAIGFQNGDVIIVEEPSAASQPSSAPSTAPAEVPPGTQG